MTYISCNFRTNLLLAASSAVLLWSVPSVAQTAPALDQAAPEPTAAASLAPVQGNSDDIIVTADKRESSVQRVPIAITAISGESLAKAGIIQIASLATSIPSFNYSEILGSAKLNIRGIGFSNTAAGAEGSVAYNLNDVYVSRPAAQIGNFYDVSRVEVLRGPQGTLYGRNATGGAVNIYTNRPTNSWSGYGQVSYGNYNDLIAEGAVGGPVTDTLGIRMAVFSQTRDGYGKNIVTGNDVNNVRSRSARLTALWRPAPNLAITVIGDIGRQKDNSSQPNLIGARGLTGEVGVTGQPLLGVALGGVALQRSYNVANDMDTRYDRKTGGVVVDAKLDLGAFSIRSVSAWRHTDVYLNADIDSTSAPIARAITNEKSDTYSQELNVNYTGNRFDVTTGAYFFAEDLFGTQWSPANAAVFGFPYVPGTYVGTYAAGGNLKTRGVAVFGQGSYHATDRLTLIVGARYSTEKKTDDDLYTDFVRSGAFLAPADLNNPKLPFAAPNRVSARFNSFTPKFGVNFQVNPQTLLYASVSKGFKAGLFNLGGTQVIPTSTGVILSNPAVKPESVWAYEAGLKVRGLSNRLRLNLAGFYYDYSDLQLSKLVGTAAQLTNAAAARIYGVEAEANFDPTPELRFNLNGSWMHARFTDFFNTDPGRPSLGLLDLSGNRMPQAPDFTANAGVEYRIAIAHGTIVPRVQGNWSSKVFFDEFNVAAISQPSFGKADVSLAYEAVAGYKIIGFINNITNEKTADTAYQSVALTGYPINGVLAPPRTYGVRLRYSF
ncbi:MULTISPECIES: TonB-dependent receptor [Sphingomonas]|uniref:TonB-dependent receptor n=1 Tax=Sphingomonas TaxID=13687 RepID=UPI00241334D1|nr:TonB-dependent receptor [Sphingomonas echinoides]